MSLFTGEKLPIKFTTVSIDLASINATTSVETDVAVPGAEPGDMVIVNVPASLNAGLAFSGARVKSSGVVALRMTNVTSGAINDTARNYVFGILKAL